MAPLIFCLLQTAFIVSIFGLGGQIFNTGLNVSSSLCRSVLGRDNLLNALAHAGHFLLLNSCLLGSSVDIGHTVSNVDVQFLYRLDLASTFGA